MKVTLSTSGTSFSFTAYGDGWVEVNGQRHTRSLVLDPGHSPAAWAENFAALDEDAFRSLLDWQPDIVIFGSGRSFRFPHPKLTRFLAEARIGVEVMDTPAACRTYNVLAGEGRKVLAAILID